MLFFNTILICTNHTKSDLNKYPFILYTNKKTKYKKILLIHKNCFI